MQHVYCNVGILWYIKEMINICINVGYFISSSLFQCSFNKCINVFIEVTLLHLFWFQSMFTLTSKMWNDNFSQQVFTSFYCIDQVLTLCGWHICWHHHQNNAEDKCNVNLREMIYAFPALTQAVYSQHSESPVRYLFSTFHDDDILGCEFFTSFSDID